MKFKIKQYLSNYPCLYRIIYAVYSLYLLFLDKKDKIIGMFFNILPLKNNKIVICNYYGKGYGDNAKYIVEEIVRQNLKYDIVWLLRKDLIGKKEFPKHVRVVKYNSIRGLYELATAKIWIDNCRKTFYPPKRKRQFYIQTWHGGIALKRIEMDVKDKLSKNYIRFAKKDSKMANLFISNSKFCTDMYRRAFLYNGEVLECGSPRVDVLVNKNYSITRNIKKYFNIEQEAKILIYAPTFRKDFNIDCYDIDFIELLRVLESKYNSKWYIFMRLHPNMPFTLKIAGNYDNNKIIDVTDYDDLYELLLSSDILITDYSSIMFEFSLLRRPVFLYASDIEMYKQDRDFYFDIANLPYPLAENNQELFYNIRNFNEEIYLKNLDKFMERLNICENGYASEKVVERIKNIIEK